MTRYITYILPAFSFIFSDILVQLIFSLYAISYSAIYQGQPMVIKLHRKLALKVANHAFFYKNQAKFECTTCQCPSKILISESLIQKHIQLDICKYRANISNERRKCKDNKQDLFPQEQGFLKIFCLKNFLLSVMALDLPSFLLVKYFQG